MSYSEAVKAVKVPDLTVKTVTIRPPNIQVAKFKIIGTAPLVIHRFSVKLKQQLLDKHEQGKSASSKKTRTAQDSNKKFEDARYISKEGWDGFHAAAIRNALISACRLVNFKMTLAKMSLFVLADGWDTTEPQIPLVRIHGTAKRQDDPARVETGQPYITTRAAYYDWSAIVRIRYDADQYSLDDVTNLLSRVGAQVGICEGRPDSKNSAGMGWGLFELEQKPQHVE